MKNKILILLITLLCLVPSIEAKWWIFGGSEEEVSFNYLYVGNLSFDDINQEAIILESSLDEGYLHIRGKGRSGKNTIGNVSISLDGAKTWQKVKFEKDGGFDFTFEPDLKATYDIYVKIIDTSGKSNEIEDSHVKISFSDLDVQEQIEKTLNALRNAYQNENDTKFMEYVSENFEGDDVTLERAIRKDFSVLEDINIDFTINSVAFSNNKYYASISFNRRVTSAYDASSIDDSGVTEFSFSVGKNGAMLLSMKHPLIFGLTYANDVASGVVASTQNSDKYLTISNDGTVKEESIQTISQGGEEDDYATSGSFTLENGCNPPCNNADGFNFTDDNKTTLISDSEINKEINMLWGQAGTTMQNLGNLSISNITVPDNGYTNNASLSIGETIAIRLANNTYAVIKVTSMFTSPPPAIFKISFDYKYNPGGSKTFK